MNTNQEKLTTAMAKLGWRKVPSSTHVAMRRAAITAFIRPDRSIELKAHDGSHFCNVQSYSGRGWVDVAVSIATAATKTKLTSEQFDDILHTIGAGAGNYARPGYRNRYDAGEDWRPSLDALVDAGLMARGSRIGCYHVTPKGAAEVGCAGCLGAHNG